MNIPQHVAIILDGNRRWAKERGLPTLLGHKKGFEQARKITKYAAKIGIKYLSFFAFSTENWKRSKDEKLYLFKLYRLWAVKEFEELNKTGFRVIFSGDIDAFPDDLPIIFKKLIDKSKDNTGMVVNLCLNYGSKQEILRATKLALVDKLNPDDLSEEKFYSYFYTKDLPPVDLMIRSSGEQRISNFLLWQISYAELFFIKKRWPDFGQDDLDKIIEEFNNRERRIGK
ncbi:MAG: di-trans,poly-cis-decaprenylcistransferase [uncultured bacterium]|nr:MAG: di-trans,poly-cis-decaprenylcistransferase [uncultured bacterium]